MTDPVEVSSDTQDLRARLAACWDGDDDPSDAAWREAQADRAMAVVEPVLSGLRSELEYQGDLRAGYQREVDALNLLLSEAQASRQDWAVEAMRLDIKLSARPTVSAYEASCEALEKRRVALVAALGLPDGSGFYEAVEDVAELRASLRRPVSEGVGNTPIPDDAARQIENVLGGFVELTGDDPEVPALLELFQSWRGSAATNSKADADEVRSLRAELRLEEDNVAFAEKVLHLVLRCCDGQQDSCPALEAVYGYVRLGEKPPILDAVLLPEQWEQDLADVLVPGGDESTFARVVGVVQAWQAATPAPQAPVEPTADPVPADHPYVQAETCGDCGGERAAHKSERRTVSWAPAAIAEAAERVATALTPGAGTRGYFLINNQPVTAETLHCLVDVGRAVVDYVDPEPVDERDGVEMHPDGRPAGPADARCSNPPSISCADAGCPEHGDPDGGDDATAFLDEPGGTFDIDDDSDGTGPTALRPEVRGEWCEKCNTTVTGSHWHCAKCGQRSSMMGHSMGCPDPDAAPQASSTPPVGGTQTPAVPDTEG